MTATGSGERMTALVLGLGGNVSQGILKALHLSSLPLRVVGACISPHGAGLFGVERAYISPPAADPHFLEWLVGTCRTEAVRAILSGVEPVLDVLAANADAIREETGAVSVVSPPEVLAVGRDKLQTSSWLEEHGFNHAASVDAADSPAVHRLAEEVGFPLVAKPRFGKGSRGLSLLQDASDLESLAGRAGYIVQEYVGEVAHEYSAGTYVDARGNLRGCFVVRRELTEGTSSVAEVGDFGPLRGEAGAIATALRPLGPCNVQMRLDRERPVCFELNIRFSGTTPLRAHFGFNEVEASIRELVLGEPPSDLPTVTRGLVVRYWNELYLDPGAPLELERNGVLDDPAGRVSDVGRLGP